MSSWINDQVILAALIFTVALVLSFAVSLAVILRLPPDYLGNPEEPSIRVADHGLFVRVGTVLKNLLGAILVVLGVILSVPGLPGQGLLTVLAGMLLLDFPGKRKFLCKILSRPPLLHLVNRLRTAFARAPFVIG